MKRVMLISGLIFTFGLAVAGADGTRAERLEREQEAMEKMTRKYESPVNFGFGLSYSPRVYPSYPYATGITSSSAGHVVTGMWEWLPIQEYGKAGIGVSAGFGVHPDTVVVAGGGTAGEDLVATLYTVPVELHFSYHFDYVRNQILVPYVKFGPSLTLIKQNSAFGYFKDGIQSFSGLDIAGGMQICLNPLEPSSARALDLSTGINTTYLLVEYHVTSPLGAATDTDLSRNEWRFGIHFEF